MILLGGKEVSASLSTKQDQHCFQHSELRKETGTRLASRAHIYYDKENFPRFPGLTGGVL